MTRSIHEGFLLGSRLVGSETTWDNPSDDKRYLISEPSGVASPSGHQYWEWALMSPVKKVAKGCSVLIFAYKFLLWEKGLKIRRVMIIGRI